MIKSVFRLLAHLFLGIRRYNDKCIKVFAKDVKNKRILEIGSGKDDHGKDYYSAKRFFDESNDFIQSDVTPEYGHQVIDITNWDAQEEYDIILCMNVLEHVYDYQKGVDNMYRALKAKGQLVVFVPMFYPLHDEHDDYWRFTEHALRMILSKLKCLSLSKHGFYKMPVAYFGVFLKSSH